jgi:hypothetical protein
MTLIEFLSELDARRISYKLDRVRDALMVIVNIPGERWEVEFMDEDGHVEAECFRSDGHMFEEDVLPSILERGS